MRTTVTLDDDLAVRLERRRAEEGISFKEVLNAVLRRGLDAMAAQREQGAVDIQPLPVGRRLLDVENIAEVLALAEGDDYR